MTVQGDRGASAYEAAPECVRRLGVVGDVHTEHVRLRAALDFLVAQGVDALLCTGDIPDGPGSGRDVDRCCALLQARGVRVVSGNHDRWLLDGEMRNLSDATALDDVSAATRAYLRALPQTLDFETPRGRLLLCHGLGADDMAELRPYDRGAILERNAALQALLTAPRYALVVGGHTHRPMVRTIETVTFVNAGTLLRDHGPCCTLLDLGDGRVQSWSVGETGEIGQPAGTTL